ncbi:hypothetical protein [Promicromonospora umidemergens]|uniref:hypothetical protein n=1 Tax=Promicromonospora umidemergens TaxID=629679 RepID=UPI0020A47C38|nr:hypothetical protein [Promicromonospora umidemergens]
MPVTLPRTHVVVDQDGHLAVTVDGQPWQPPAPTDGSARAHTGGLSLGRSDLEWAQEQIAEELDTPVVVHLVDGGQAYEPYFVVPDSYRPLEPNSLSGTAVGEAGPVAESGLGSIPGGRGGFTPGEPVALVQVVGRAVADEHGAVRFRLPAALGDRTRSLLIQGQVSGTTLPYDDLPQPSGHAVPSGAAPAPGSSGVPDLARPSPQSGDHDVRREPVRRPAPAPAARPTPTAPDVPDTGLGAL